MLLYENTNTFCSISKFQLSTHQRKLLISESTVVCGDRLSFVTTRFLSPWRAAQQQLILFLHAYLVSNNRVLTIKT